MVESDSLHSTSSGSATTQVASLSRLLPPQHYPNNLPLQLTSFVGRENEISAIKQRLWTTRLLTLTGPGGCGKTRLALRVADDVLDAFVDGVWWIELASLVNPNLIAQTIASALGLRAESNPSLVETLIDYLRPKQTLLIFDNCEHLIETCAQLIDTLLQACPDLYVMTTSREVLDIGGEAVSAVPPMATPHPREVPPLETLTHFEAVKLFVERAATALPGFKVHDHNASAIAQVCYRLDGMPLAIELAAARVKVLQADQIAARLDDRFSLLTGGKRTALLRHQTLRAAIDWSYDLLNEDEQRMFRRLAVFAGGWTLEAAEAVCADPAQDKLAGISSDKVLNLLTHLVNKSLVVVERTQGRETRYRLLETIRQYALERLHEAGEVRSTRTRHLDFFIIEAGEDTKLHGPEQAVTMKRLNADRDNFRAALDWAAESGQAQAGMRLAWGLHSYWWAHGNWHEARQRIQRLLACPEAAEPTTARAAALILAGNYAFLLSDFEAGWAQLKESQELSRELGAAGRPYLGWALVLHGESLTLHDSTLAQRLFEEGIALLREPGDTWRLGIALTLYGDLATAQSDLDAAHARHLESLYVFRKLDDALGTAVATNNLGQALYRQNDYDAARAHFEEALIILRPLGIQSSAAGALAHIGYIAFMQGDYQQAVSYLEEVVAIERDIGSRARRGRALIDLAITARHCGDHARAATLWNEALPLHEELDNAYSLAVCLTGLAGLQAQPMRTTQVLAAAHTAFKASTEAIDPHYRAEHEQLTKAARNALSDESFAAAWANGCAMSPQQAIAYARVGLEASPPGDKSASAYSPSQPVKQRFGGLTKREREVAALVALGKSNREIAETLVVSEYTVASHVSNILSKLEFSSRTQIVGWAIEKGLARLPSS